MDEPLASELGFQRVVISPHPWRAVGTRAADEEIEPVNWKVSATATTPRVNRTPVAAPAQAAVPVREQAVRYVDAAATISTHHRDDRGPRGTTDPRSRDSHGNGCDDLRPAYIHGDG
ncbi:hypothetical protein [Actinacidiphila soli]|uniref:hypothetical protein n=1 Tax=Actinacidiphila soli TaxID=2487275 RepID=UPI000FCB11A7|nr:hypothetical protein [Actinacidiphila soli]